MYLDIKRTKKGELYVFTYNFLYYLLAVDGVRLELTTLGSTPTELPVIPFLGRFYYLLLLFNVGYIHAPSCRFTLGVCITQPWVASTITSVLTSMKQNAPTSIL